MYAHAALALFYKRLSFIFFLILLFFQKYLHIYDMPSDGNNLFGSNKNSEFFVPELGPFYLGGGGGEYHQKTHACNKTHLTQPHRMGSIRRVDLLIFV